MKITLIVIVSVVVLVFVFNQLNTSSQNNFEGTYSSQQDIENAKSSATNKQPSLLAQIIVSWWWYIMYYGLGIVFGMFVYRDAKLNTNLALNIRPFWWGVATVFEPPLGILAYWVIHYSKLSQSDSKD